MPKLELTIEAKVDGLLKAIEGVGARINETNRTKPWKPVDSTAIEREGKKATDKLEAQLDRADEKATHRRKTTEGAAQRERESRDRINETAAEKSDTQADVRRKRREEAGGGESPGSGAIRRSIRHRYTYAPETADIGRSFVSGVGGGAGQIAGYATRGAVAGAAEGGAAGGAAGLLRGGMIGAAVLAAFKIGQAAVEGYDMASERAHTLDSLKRQMGDVGVSFDRLKIASEAAASGLAINSKDFAAVEATLNAASGRAMESSPMGLAAAAGTTTGFARAYGMDPQATASLFGGAKNVDPKRSYMEFAGILAQTIERTGKAGSAAEVTQAVLSFAATASRLSLSQANISGYAGAYAGLTNMGIPGLTSEASAGILAQANAAASNMGAAGEAGQAFTLAAFNRKGPHLNPLEAMAEASSGLFGSRASTYATGGAMERLVGSERAARLGGRYTDAAGKVHEGDTTTNFEMIQQQAERTAGGKGPEAKELQAEMLQRYYGLQSMQQAAALMSVQATMQPGDMKGLDSVLKRAGVEVKDFNATNIQTVAKIAGSSSTGQLDEVYADLKTRTGTAALSDGDRAHIEEAKGKGFTQYQDALVKATATKDYAQDSYTVQQQMSTKMDDLKTLIGDKLLTGVTHLESSMITAMGGREKFDKGLKADAEYQRSQVRDAAADERSEIYKHDLSYGSLSAKDQARLRELDQEQSTGEKYTPPTAENKAARSGAPGKDGGAAMTLPEITVVANFEHHDENGHVKHRSKHTRVARPSGQPTADSS